MHREASTMNLDEESLTNAKEVGIWLQEVDNPVDKEELLSKIADLDSHRIEKADPLPPGQS